MTNRPGAFGGITVGKNSTALLWTENNLITFHDWQSVRAADDWLKRCRSKFKLELIALQNSVFPVGTRVEPFTDAANRNFGQWEALLTVNQIPYIKTTSAQLHLIIPPLPFENPDRKIIRGCLELFPGAERYVQALIGRIERAEALLLAKWARENRAKGCENESGQRTPEPVAVSDMRTAQSGQKFV